MQKIEIEFLFRRTDTMICLLQIQAFGQQYRSILLDLAQSPKLLGNKFPKQSLALMLPGF